MVEIVHSVLFKERIDHMKASPDVKQHIARSGKRASWEWYEQKGSRLRCAMQIQSNSVISRFRKVLRFPGLMAFVSKKNWRTRPMLAHYGRNIRTITARLYEWSCMQPILKTWARFLYACF